MAKKKEEVEALDINADLSVMDLVADILDGDKDIEGICADEVTNVDPSMMVSTGIIPLDFALGGGLVKGRTYEISGPESNGKSTLCDTIVANWMKTDPNAICLRIESESTMDPLRCKKIGIDLKRMIVFETVIQEDGYEQIAKIQEKIFAKYGKRVPLLIVWDTLTAAAPRAEIEAESNSAGMMKNARVNSQELRKLNHKCAEYGHTALIIQQVREDGVDMYGNPKFKTTGGQALKHYCSARIFVKRRTPIYKDNNKNNDVIGYEVDFNMLKNKVTGVAKPVTAVMNLIEGFDPYQSAALFALSGNSAPFFKLGGAWITVLNHKGEEYGKYNGSAKLGEAIRNDSYLLKLIKYAAFYNKTFEDDYWKEKYDALVKALYTELENELNAKLEAKKPKKSEEDLKKEADLDNQLDSALDNLNI